MVLTSNSSPLYFCSDSLLELPPWAICLPPLVPPHFVNHLEGERSISADFLPDNFILIGSSLGCAEQVIFFLVSYLFFLLCLVLSTFTLMQSPWLCSPLSADNIPDMDGPNECPGPWQPLRSPGPTVLGTLCSLPFPKSSLSPPYDVMSPLK